MAWYKVADSVDNPEPFLKKVNADGKSLCLVNANGQLYAVSAYCPHAGADLSKGWCTNGNLICPFHRYAYDLSSGKGAAGQNDFIRTYPVEQRADGIYVKVDSWLDGLKNMFK